MALTAAGGVTWLDAWQGFGPATDDNRLVITGDFTLFDIAADAEIHLYASIARPGYTTGAGDTPASTNFLPRMEFPSFAQTLARVGEPSRQSPQTLGAVRLANADLFYSGNNIGSLDYTDRSKYLWRGVEFRVGTPDLVYTSFEVVQAVRFEGTPQVDSLWVELTPAPALLDTKAPAYDARYPGFDTALDSDDGTLHVEAGNSDQNIAADEDARWRLRFKIPATASAMVLWATRDVFTAAGTAGFTMYVDSAGNPFLRVADGVVEVTVSDSTVVDDGEWHDIQVWLDRSDDTLNAELGGTAFSTDGADASSLGAVTNTTKARTHERTGGSNPLTGAVDEMVFSTGSGIGYPADLRQQHREGPASIREVGAQYHLPMDEDNGAVVENGRDAKLGAQIHTPKSDAVTGTATNREIDFGDNYNKDLSADADSFTVMVWARSTNAGVVQPIFAKKSDTTAGTAGWMMLVTSGDNLSTYLSDGVDQVIASGTSGAAVGDGVWRIYAFTVDSATGTRELKQYLSDSSGTVYTQQGATVDMDAVGDTGNAITLRAGEYGSSSNRWYGDIGPIGIYSGALTIAEMARLAPIHPTKADEVTLDSYWPVDEGAGTGAGIILDAVGSIDGDLGAGNTWVTRNGTIDHGTAGGVRPYDVLVAGSGGWSASLTGSYNTVNNLYGGGGRSKPQGYGFVEQAAVVWIDNRGHDYTSVDALLTDAIVGQFHDGPDACESVELVTEGGVAALEISTTGDYVVDLANGLIYLDVSGGFPAGPIRVYFKGAKFNAGAYSDRLGLILREILTTNGHLTAGEIPAATATDLDAIRSFPVSVYIPGGQEELLTIGALLDEALSPDLYWATDLEGAVLLMGASAIDPADFTAAITLNDKVIEADSIDFGDALQPVRKVSVGFAPQRASLQAGQLLGAVRPGNRKRLSAEYRYAIAGSSTTATGDSRELILTSPLQTHADALAVAQNLLAVLGRSAPLNLSLGRFWWQVALADEGQARPDVLSVQSDHFSEISVATNVLLQGVRYEAPSPTSPPRIIVETSRPA